MFFGHRKRDPNAIQTNRAFPTRLWYLSNTIVLSPQSKWFAHTRRIPWRLFKSSTEQMQSWSELHGKWATRKSVFRIYEPAHDKTYKMACVPSKDSDQPGHPPSLIRIFAVRMKKAWILSYPQNAQRRLWSDWAHMPFCWFYRALTYIQTVKSPGSQRSCS